MTLTKGLSILIALASTAAFGFASMATPRTITPLDLLHPGMNFAYVRVTGAVVALPQLAKDDAYLSFVLQDNANLIRVSAYRQTVRGLLAAGTLPQPGDRVRVDGTLRIRDDEPVLILNAPNDLQIERPEAVRVDLSAIDALEAGDRAEVAGQLRLARQLHSGLWVLTLRDGSATADVLLQTEAIDWHPGDWVRVTGGIGEYRDTRQLSPAHAHAIQPAAAKPPDVRPISALSADLIGAWTTVSAEVIDTAPFKLGMRLELQDSDGAQIDVVIFDRVWQTLPFSETLQVGDVLQVSGEVGAFHGKLQIVPELAADLMPGAHIR